MTRIVGIRFQKAGKIYYFDPLDYELEVPMHVIVETARGVEMGTVLIAPKEVEDTSVVQPLKPVIRIATDEDERIVERNKEKEKEAFAVCKERILKHGLDMKLVAAEYTFDNNKLLFYFTADGRIDFRELVKDLASVFRTRIELRQIGVRDETKLLGGIGICGRELCCKSYMADFIPVSIKMAKEQNLSLNPTKISGTCGRLMCCLKNEQDTYEYLNSRMPSVKDTVTTPSGMRGEVASVNVLRQLVKVIVDNGDEKEMQEYRVEDLRFTPRRRKDVKLTEEEMEELKELESLEDDGETLEEESPRQNRRERRGRENWENREEARERGEWDNDLAQERERGEVGADRENNGGEGRRRENWKNKRDRGRREDREGWENRRREDYDRGENQNQGEGNRRREGWDNDRGRENGENGREGGRGEGRSRGNRRGNRDRRRNYENREHGEQRGSNDPQ